MFLPKMHNLNIIMRKHSKSPNPNGDAFYKVTDRHFQKWQGHERHGNTEELSQIPRDKGSMTTNTTWDTALDSGTKKISAGKLVLFKLDL